MSDVATALAPRRRQPAAALALVLAGIVLALGVFEGTLALLLAFPVRVPGLQPVMRDLYRSVDRDLIQYDAAMSRYDPELFYTLRPGRFVFTQREFRHEYRVNSLGVRDEEMALDGPEVVVLGDSYAMGWGVAQPDRFADVIGREMRLKVLDAGVSSYGTVREALMLNRIDTRRLRYLIIEYQPDDFTENYTYLMRGNRHLSRDETRYQYWIDRIRRARRYVPGKYTWDVVSRAVGAPFRTPEPHPSGDQQADVFLNALVHVPRADLSRVRLIVFEIDGDRLGERALVDALRRRVAAGPYPDWIRQMTIVDLSQLLRPEHFWVLDEHANARGHRLIADVLMAAMRAAPPP